MNWLRSKKIILTHDNNFHADDVFSVATLSLFFKGNIKIIRTRDQTKFSKADYLIDVGQEYDPTKNKFDHHLTGDIPRRSNGVPYAAFGLIWKELGEKICLSDKVAEIIDKKLVQSSDAHDNGFSLVQSNILDISDYDISDYIHSINAVCENKNRDRTFKKLVNFACDLILTEIKSAELKIMSESIINKGYDLAKDKRIIVVDEDCSSSAILSNYPEPLFFIKPAPESGAWKIYTVKDKKDIYKNRLSLPSVWAGKSREELVKMTGIDDVLYSDHRLFMAMTKTKEGAIKLAQLALE